MKTKITVLTILAAVSLWAVAQNNENNDMNNSGSANNGTLPGGTVDGRHHRDLNHGEMNTNSDSEYGGGATNRWRGKTNHWENSDDTMSKTNRHHWKPKAEGPNENPPQN